MVANIEWFKKRLAILPWFSSQPVHFLHIYGLQSAEEILCHSYRFAFCNLLDILVIHEKSYAVMTFFFFFIFHPDALFSCLRVIWVVWTPQVPRLINFERFWSILFSSDIFRRRKFTTGKDFQCSQTRVPNSGPKTNNVQNSGRYQLLLLYCIDYSIVWWVPKSNMGFYLTIRKHYGEEFIFNCTKINWIFLHYYI